MIRKIVVPVDGSAASERIISHVAELRRAVDAGVHLVHVTGSELLAQMKGRDYLRSLENRAKGVLPIDSSALRTGEPAFEILKYAVVERAELMAFTTRGASLVRRVLFGSTAIELLRSSQVPLLVARPEWPVRPLRRILAAIDASKASRGAIAVTAELARGTGAEIVLTRILVEGESRESVEASLERSAAALAAEGVRVDARLGSGDPARGILDAARETRSDLIALGTHGRRGTDRFFFGSVAESVLLGSEVPMLLRRAARVPRFPRSLTYGART